MKKYKLSFTAASLSINESIKIAEIYLQNKDWGQTKALIKKNNSLQSRTNSRTVRTTREIVQRLELLSDEQLALLVEGNLSEQKYILWFAVCKTYEILREFATEVLREKYLARNMKMAETDYDAFFNRKADWNEGLEKITTLTSKKLRQVTLLMLHEAGLTSKDNTILQAIMTKRLIEVLRSDAPMSFQIFPVEPSDLER